MSVAVSALTIVASSKAKSEGTLRGCVNQSETLRKLNLTVEIILFFNFSFVFFIFSSQHFVELATSLLFPVALRRLTYVIKWL